MPVLNGPYSLWNVAWETRLADLHDFQSNGDVIGYSSNGGSNQKWYFQHIAGNDYHIASASDTNVFILNDQNQLRGDPTGTIFTVEYPDPNEDPSGNIKIVCPDFYNDERTVYWTLTSGSAGTQITLVHAIRTTNKYQQMWHF